MKPGAWLFRLIGLAIFVFLLTRIDLSESWAVLKGANIWLLLLGLLLLNFIILAVRVLRWRYILLEMGHRLGFRRLAGLSLIGLLASVVTPARSGELIKIWYLKQDGVSKTKSFVSIILDRALELAVIAGFAFAGLIWYRPHFDPLIIGILGSLLVFGLLIPRIWRPLARRLGTVLGQLKIFRLASSASFYNLLISFMNFVNMAVLAKALGIEIGFLPLAFIVSMVYIVNIIPISYLGLGTRDAALIFLFSLEGIGAPQAMAFSLLFLVIYFVNAAAGLVAWQLHPLPSGRHSGASSQ